MTDTQTTVGVVAESGTDERRVALVPKAVGPLVKSGVAVVVESGAGEGALLPDGLYTEAGASIGDGWAADIVVKVAPPSAEEVSRLRSGQTLIGFLAPRDADNSIGALTQAGVQGFALEAIPRISRAQMDALSSQANVAGPVGPRSGRIVMRLRAAAPPLRPYRCPRGWTVCGARGAVAMAAATPLCGLWCLKIHRHWRRLG
jgi:NAD/NADP transhydrogenase alpha subunit